MQKNSAFMLSFFCVNFSRKELTLLNTALEINLTLLKTQSKIAFLKGTKRLKNRFENILIDVKKYK